MTGLGGKDLQNSIWANLGNNLESWTLDVDFTAGGLVEAGGGLAIWYTTDQGFPGPAYGNKDTWDGLGIFIDSAIKDESGNEDSGSVHGHLNDGTTSFVNTISKDPKSHAFSLCHVNYRNTGYLTQVKISYAPGLFRILVNNQVCVQTDKIVLPKGGYFGISAGGTGNVDNFSLYRVETFVNVQPSVEQVDNAMKRKEKQQQQQNEQQKKQQMSNKATTK